MKLRSLLMASAVIFAGSGTFSANAKSLNAAVGLGPKNMITKTMESFAKYVGKNSDIKIKVFSMSLLNLKETPKGIRNGVADLGFVLTAYFPAEYAETNLVAEPRHAYNSRCAGQKHRRCNCRRYVGVRF